MKKIRFANHISWQQVLDDNFLYVYNIKTHRYYSFSDTEIYIWKLIDEYKIIGIDQIVNLCTSFYELDKSVIEDDITNFVNGLVETGVVEYVK